MKKFLIFLLINIGSVNVYSQQTFKINLKDIATVTFPGAPKESKMVSMLVYEFENNGIVYITSAEEIKKNSIHLSKYTLNKIYNTFISGALAGSKSKLLYKNKRVLNGLEGVEFGYIRGLNVSPRYVFGQAFYLNETLISVGVSMPDSLQKNDQKVQSFLDSFKFTITR